MNRSARIALAGAMLAAASAAGAATFRAEVQPESNTIIIYATNKKAALCSASVMFSYKYGEERRTTRLECNGPAPAEKDYVFCKRTNAEYVDLKIERPANGGCE